MVSRHVLWVAVGVGILVVLVVGGAVGYQMWKGSPEYALLQVKEAIETHDRDMFHEYVDVETVVARGVDVFLKQSQEESDGEEDESGFAAMGKELAKGLFEMMKPKLVEMATTAIDSYIESTGEVDSEGESDEKKLDLSVLEPGGIVKTTREGKIVLADLSLRHKKYEVDFTAQLKFRESDAGHLQVVEIANIEKIFDTLNAAEKAWKLAKNKPVREELDKALTLASLSLNKKSDRWGFKKTATLNLEVDNLTQKGISKFDGDIEVFDKDGKRVLALPTNAEPEKFDAGSRFSGSIVYEIGMFDTNLQSLWNADFDSLSSNIKVNGLTYDNGETVQIPYPGIE